MGSEVIVIPAMLGVVFGIFYLFISSRHRERLALIEKGADASIFYSSNKGQVVPLWKVIIINLSCLMMGIGLGVLISGVFGVSPNIDANMVIPGTIFFMAGVGLITGFFLTKKLTESDK